MVPAPTALHAAGGVCCAGDAGEEWQDEQVRGAKVGGLGEDRRDAEREDYEDVAAEEGAEAWVKQDGDAGALHVSKFSAVIPRLGRVLSMGRETLAAVLMARWMDRSPREGG